MTKWFWPHLGQFSCAAKKIVFWWETKSKDSLSTAAAAGGIRFKSSVSVFLFPPVCFGRDLCFGLNCQSANKQGHCGWVTGSKTSKLHKHWTKLAATVVSPFFVQSDDIVWWRPNCNSCKGSWMEQTICPTLINLKK